MAFLQGLYMGRKQRKKVRDLCIKLPQLSTVTEDKNEIISSTGKWPLIIDKTDKVASMLDCCGKCTILTGFDLVGKPSALIRRSLLAAIRQGKPLVIHMGNIDMYKLLKDKMDDIEEGLLDAILDKSLIEDHKYLNLIRESDRVDGPASYYSKDNARKFIFAILTTKDEPNEEFTARMTTVEVNV